MTLTEKAGSTACGWAIKKISARIQGVLNFPLSLQANAMAVSGIGYLEYVSEERIVYIFSIEDIVSE
jgi:hypothetical protein